MASPASYAASLKLQLSHAPMSPLAPEEKRRVERMIRNERVEPKIGIPFDLTIGAINPITTDMTLIKVDYNNLSMRCRYCLSTMHLVKECEAPMEVRWKGQHEATPAIHSKEGATPHPSPTGEPPGTQSRVGQQVTPIDHERWDTQEGGQETPILWRTREARQGRESSPNTSKFLDVNEFCEDRND
ncbi:uncharacterized protein [Physcomitrium patens]|uniref:uncharacterized protein isoform X1 n=1 Tax=Physcomitrium patens TaxID=3218 RepID=UPI000D175CA1|nr:uncharacterized protein LOC112293347 [Physcomitrium patens]|eukprot:XP_024398413.1 uncharacterized protein LOC112293347 [Physcomitrella patens]